MRDINNFYFTLIDKIISQTLQVKAAEKAQNKAIRRKEKKLDSMRNPNKDRKPYKKAKRSKVTIIIIKV